MALVKDITCIQAVALIGDYLEGGLSRRERRRLEKHLAGCGACSAYLAQMRETIALAGRVTPADLAPEALDALMDVYDQFLADRDDPQER